MSLRLPVSSALNTESHSKACAPSVPRDEAENERRLIVGVELGPVHGDDEIAAHADHLHDPERNNSQTSIPWLLSRRSTCLIACLADFPRACASA